MANRAAPALVLRPGDREELERWTRSSTVPASAAKRARIVLLAADGTANTRIAELVDATVTTVLSWRERYQAKGLEGLSDAQRSGRARTLDHPRDRGRDVEAAAQEARCHALVIAAAGRQARHRKRLGGAGLAGLWGQTVEGGVVSVLPGREQGPPRDPAERRRPSTQPVRAR